MRIHMHTYIQQTPVFDHGAGGRVAPHRTTHIHAYKYMTKHLNMRIHIHTYK